MPHEMSPETFLWNLLHRPDVQEMHWVGRDGKQYYSPREKGPAVPNVWCDGKPVTEFAAWWPDGLLADLPRVIEPRLAGEVGGSRERTL